MELTTTDGYRELLQEIFDTYTEGRWSTRCGRRGNDEGGQEAARRSEPASRRMLYDIVLM